MRPWSQVSRLAEALGGLPVLGCLEGSTAAEAGVRYGDVLLAVDGKPTATWEDFLRARGQAQGRFVARIFRDGSEMEIPVDLRASSRSPLEVLVELLDKRLAGGGGASDTDPS